MLIKHKLNIIKLIIYTNVCLHIKYWHPVTVHLLVQNTHYCTIHYRLPLCGVSNSVRYSVFTSFRHGISITVRYGVRNSVSNGESNSVSNGVSNSVSNGVSNSASYHISTLYRKYIDRIAYYLSIPKTIFLPSL